MRFIRFLFIAVLLLCVVAAGGIYIVLNNSDHVTDLLVETVKKQTGRTLSIAGGIRPSLSLSPSLTVSDVSLSNPEWAKKPFMLEAEALSVGIELLPLLEGKTRIHSVTLSNATIALEESKGRKSWEFETKTDEAPEQENVDNAQDSADADAPKPSSSMDIAELMLSETTLLYHKGGKTRTIVIHSAKASQLDLTNATVGNVELDGQYEKAPVALKASLTEADILQFDAALTDTPHTLSANGSVSLKDMTFDAGVTIKTDSVKSLAALFGESVSDNSAVKATASAGGTPDVIKLSKLDVSYGKYTFNGGLTINLAGSPTQISGNLSSPELVFGSTKTSSNHKTPDASAAPENESAKPETPLPDSLPEGITADLRLSASKLRFNDIDLSDVKTTFVMKNQRLTLSPLSAKAGGGSVNGRLDYNVAGSTPSIALSLNSTDVLLEKLIKSAAKDIEGGKINAMVSLNGAGKTVESYLSSVQGDISVLAKDTTYKNPPKVTQAASFFQLLKPQDDNAINVECALASFDVSKGVATSKVIAAKAPGAYVTGKGTMNLAQQTMALTFQARSDVIGLADVAPPLKLKGPWSSPAVSVDKTNTLLNLGKWALGAATGVGLVAIAGEQLFDKTGITRDDPCVQSLETSQQKASEANANPKDAVKNAEDAISGQRDAIKEQFDTKEKEIHNLRDNLKGIKDLF